MPNYQRPRFSPNRSGPDNGSCALRANQWFKRGTVYRRAVDVLRTAAEPLTARAIADALIADRAPQATGKQTMDLQAAILAALRRRDGGTVLGEGSPARSRLHDKA